MNQQDKPDEDPEKTESENAAEGEEGQAPEDAAETAAAGDGEKPADSVTEGEDAPEGTDKDDPDSVTAEAEDATSEGADSQGDDETSGESKDETADAEPESGADDRPETTEPETIDLEQALGTAPLVSDGTPPEPEPAPEPAPEASAPHEHEEEEHHRSFAARVLTWLVLLIAGGGLALWGGPKVAPHLPSGLGPVKAWLMPGALDTEAELAALGARLDARIDAVEEAAAEPPAVPEDAIQAAVADLESRLTPRLDDLADQVGAIDREAIETRLTQLETKVEGLAAQVEGLASLGEGTAELSEEDLARISAFSATVDGVRAELSTLADKQGELSQRIDDVAAAAQRRITEAEEEVAAASQQAEATKSAAMAQAAATTIGAALTAGEPYEVALAQLDENTDVEIPEALTASAASGVTPLGTLRESFPDAAHEAIRATIRAKDDSSVGGRLAAFIEAQVASRSLTPQQGDSTDAILSRAEDALRRDNLAAAVSELESLSEPARAAMQDWISRAEARVAARSALTGLNAALTAGN